MRPKLRYSLPLIIALLVYIGLWLELTNGFLEIDLGLDLLVQQIFGAIEPYYAYSIILGQAVGIFFQLASVSGLALALYQMKSRRFEGDQMKEMKICSAIWMAYALWNLYLLNDDGRYTIVCVLISTIYVVFYWKRFLNKPKALKTAWTIWKTLLVSLLPIPYFLLGLEVIQVRFFSDYYPGQDFMWRWIETGIIFFHIPVLLLFLLDFMDRYMQDRRNYRKKEDLLIDEIGKK